MMQRIEDLRAEIMAAFELPAAIKEAWMTSQAEADYEQPCTEKERNRLGCDYSDLDLSGWNQIVWPHDKKDPSHQEVLGYTRGGTVPAIFKYGCSLHEPVVEVKGKAIVKQRRKAKKVAS